MSIAAVLLNYRDPQAAVSASERIRGYRNIDRIFLVDNASGDDSAALLSAYGEKAGQKVKLLVNEKNGGYGYGNNRGVREAQREGHELTLICNPDAVFSEETVDILSGAFSDSSVAAAGALMTGAKAADCAWPLLDLRGEIRFSAPVLKRIFRKEVSYPDSFFRKLPNEAGAVHGSLLMVRTGDFLRAGGFDERVFLFCEEKILGHRLSAIGKKVVLTGGEYAHAGSETMKKAGMGPVCRQKERQRSERLFFREYLHAGPVRMFFIRLLQAAVMLETRLLSLVKSTF